MTLKELLFNKDTVSMLANSVFNVYHDFDKAGFINEALLHFPKQELKERMTTVRVVLEKYLPNDYVEAIEILTNAFNDFEESHFIYGSILEYIEYNGLSDEHLKLSLNKLGDFTKYFSAEFAIRPFFNSYPESVLTEVLKWAQSDDIHQRRLASEGVRPSLPWGMNINIDYKDGAKSLEYLYYDTERYVTRSVANHLNDISKKDPEFVLKTLKRWKNSHKQDSIEMEYIIKHSLRTLVKKGHNATLEFLGYNLNPKIDYSILELSAKEVNIGGKLHFNFEVFAKEAVTLIIDYNVIYPTKHGKTTKKTYKLKTINVKNNQKIQINGSRSFKPISTRTLYPGVHKIEIQVNGKIILSDSFTLK
ncbi:DNA alkylation repair protein [Mycoplasmatota bacterium WC30]